MIIDILTVVCIAILSIKVIILEVQTKKLALLLEDTVSRNRIQHENIEKEVHYINRQCHKLHLNSIYGECASRQMDEYIKQDIEALKESAYRFYADTDSIKVEKEDSNDN